MFTLKHQGELKNPLENKNKHIRSKGPTPNTKSTIFAFLGFVLFSPLESVIWEVIFFFDFFLGIPKNRFLKTIITIIIYDRRNIRYSNLA